MNMTAITYPYVTVNNFTGENLKNLLEDICDNLFNPDPYYQQGGDMVRVGGLHYSCEPSQKIGRRISNLQLNGKSVDAGKTYRLAGWAPVAEGVTGEPVWDVVTRYLRDKKVLQPPVLNRPRLTGVAGNPGITG